VYNNDNNNNKYRLWRRWWRSGRGEMPRMVDTGPVTVSASAYRGSVLRRRRSRRSSVLCARPHSIE